MATCRMLMAALMLVLATAAGRPGYAALSGALGEEPRSLPDPVDETRFGSWLFRLVPDIDLGAVLTFEALRLRAETGDPEARFALAMMWIEGRGVELTWAKGLALLEQAAAADDLVAGT